MNRLLTPQDLKDFLIDRNYEESAIREIIADPHFSLFSGAYIKLILMRKKLSVDFIRELRGRVKILDWNKFLVWYERYYTEEEKEKLRREFHIVDYGGYYAEEKR